MDVFLFFMVALVCSASFVESNFHGRVILRKDGSVDIPQIGRANFQSNCVKNDLCTFNLSAPAVSKELFDAVQTNHSSESQALATVQTQLNVENSTWYEFLEGTFGDNFANISATLLEIEAKIQNASALMDQVEAAIQNSQSKLTPIQNSLNAAPLCYTHAWTDCQKTTTPASTSSETTTSEYTGSTLSDHASSDSSSSSGTESTATEDITTTTSRTA